MVSSFMRDDVCAQENKVMLEAGPVYEALGLPPSHQFKSPGASPKVSPCMHREPLAPVPKLASAYMRASSSSPGYYP